MRFWSVRAPVAAPSLVMPGCWVKSAIGESRRAIGSSFIYCTWKLLPTVASVVSSVTVSLAAETETVPTLPMASFTFCERVTPTFK